MPAGMGRGFNSVYELKLVTPEGHFWCPRSQIYFVLSLKDVRGTLFKLPQYTIRERSEK